MAGPSPEDKKAPEPEALKPQDDASTATTSSASEGGASAIAHRVRHVTYRPSHKATFIGIAVVVAILAVNAVVLFFFLRGGNPTATADREEVTLSSASLDKLGVSRNPVGDLGTQLIIGPDSRFNGKVTVASDVSVSGQLKLNSKFTASAASLSQLEAGQTTFGQLNVNGDGTVTTLNARRDLNVAGASKLQGPVTFGGLVTINNSLNIAGNLAVGGTLSARAFQASSLISDSTLVVGGHIVTRGSAPGVSAGGAVGSNGTVSISGNDTSGTVAVNVGAGAGGGILANISFRSNYGTTPHVVVTAVGRGAGSVYVNRTGSGFSIGTSDSLSPGGYAFDYIVMQ